ncbi:MAG: hypothetical protein AAF449_19775, partial [Myxococcota bacterium]
MFTPQAPMCRGALLFALVWAFAACSDDTTPPMDAGTSDAGRLRDVGIPDSGSAADVGSTDVGSADGSALGAVTTIDTQTSYISQSGNQRLIDIRLWYAEDGPNTNKPLIIVSHGGVGATGAQTRFAHLGFEYAEHGYVAAVLNHPPSPGREQQHRVDRPSDVRAVLDHLTTFTMPINFSGRIDTENAGHIGHSYGAYTSHAVGGGVFDGNSFRDGRIRAIVPMSPQGDERFGSFDVQPDPRRPSSSNTWASITIPAYVIFGEYEERFPTDELHRRDDWRAQPYARYPDRINKFMSIVPQAPHSAFGNQGPTDVQQFVAINSRLFFDRFLKEESIDPCQIGLQVP